MFLQYYVTESTTGNQVNIEINEATKTDLDDNTERLAEQSGTQIHP